MVAGVELSIDKTATATEMAETIFGDGVQVLTATYTGDSDSSGIYSDGLTTSSGVVPTDTGVMFSTGDLDGFTNNNPFQSNLSTGRTTSSSGLNCDPDFNTVADMIEGVSTIFPELQSETKEIFSQAAIRTLKSYEARVLSRKWAT